MTILVIISAFVGVAALVGGLASLVNGATESIAEDRLGVLTGQVKNNSVEQDATVISRPLDDMPNAVEAIVAKFLNLTLFLEQANINLTPSKFLLIVGVLAGTGVFVVLVAGLSPLFAPIAALTLSVLPFVYAVFARNMRKKAFAKQLPEALELIARALRSGHSLGAGFQLVASEMQDPISTEFRRCYEEQNLGIPMDDALDSLASRVPNLDLRFFATAVILQRQTGGDLAEILDKIGYLIRERFKIWGQVQALTGEGRLSGIVLLALPPALFAVMLKLNYGYIMLLFEDPMGKQMLAFAIVMQLVGAIVIKKIVNIKV
ncbi:MAG: type II secretion system F family protein [Planctomycetaceae bacterium]|nr:type II secretion system F family protein [Planctomycetaceae bacterium]